MGSHLDFIAERVNGFTKDYLVWIETTRHHLQHYIHYQPQYWHTVAYGLKLFKVEEVPIVPCAADLLDRRLDNPLKHI